MTRNWCMSLGLLSVAGSIVLGRFFGASDGVQCFLMGIGLPLLLLGGLTKGRNARFRKNKVRLLQRLQEPRSPS